MLAQAKALKNCVFMPPVAKTGPVSINVEVNNACNPDCLMCDRASYYKKNSRIDLDRFKGLYEQIRAPYVALHGYGEPLIHKDLFPIIGYLHEQGARTSITSNLILLTKDNVEPLIRSGLGLLKVSFDSHVDTTYAAIRGKEAVGKVVENILLFEETKRRLGVSSPNLRLSYTIQPANYRELPDFVEFASKTLGQKTAFFQLLLFRNTMLADQDLGEISKESFRRKLQDAVNRARDLGLRTNLPDLLKDFDSTWAFYEADEVRGNTVKCPKPWLTSYISASGDVKTSSGLPTRSWATPSRALSPRYGTRRNTLSSEGESPQVPVPTTFAGSASP